MNEREGAVRARCEAATTGPWVHPELGFNIDTDDRNTKLFHVFGWSEQAHKDADFVANARTDLPDALDKIDRLTAALADMTAERDALTNVLSQLNGVMCGVRDERDKLREQINREEHEFEALITQREQERDAAQRRAEAAEGLIDRALIFLTPAVSDGSRAVERARVIMQAYRDRRGLEGGIGGTP